jgi:hypothetical protein
MARCSIASISPASGISAASPVSRAVLRQWSVSAFDAIRISHAANGTPAPLELRQAGERLLEHRRRDVLGRRTVADAPADEAEHTMDVAVVQLLEPRRVGLCRRHERPLVVFVDGDCHAQSEFALPVIGTGGKARKLWPGKWCDINSFPR